MASAYKIQYSMIKTKLYSKTLFSLKARKEGRILAHLWCITFFRLQHDKKLRFIDFFQGQRLPDDIASGVIISNHSLVLQRVTRKAAGIFTCQATNAEGSTISNALELIVKCKSKPYHFILKEQDCTFWGAISSRFIILAAATSLHKML